MDAIFKALNDPTRRRLLDLLRAKDGQTLSDLVEQTEMTRFGVMKHLGVLEEASLVVARRQGRFKHHHLNAAPLQTVIDRWIEPLLAKPLARMALDLKTVLEGDDAMKDADAEKPDVLLETWIRTTPDKLWAALTEPEMIRKYNVNGAAPKERIAGPGKFTHMTPDGNPMLSGDVQVYIPGERLEMTFEPHWVEDAPPSRCVYEIEAKGATCKLTILHYNLPPGMEGVRSGWSVTLSGIKTLLETGEALGAEW
ncbi:MAG: metalloregulator ArsR/SmtB family transcription factor [Pseudomonadota bacterium]